MYSLSKIKSRLVTWGWVLFLSCGFAQAQSDKLVNLAFSFSTLGDSFSYGYSLDFNRTASSSEKAGNVVFYLNQKASLRLQPSSSIDIGNGIKVAKNNVVADIPLIYNFNNLSKKIPGVFFEIGLTPYYVSDKNLNTGFLFGGIRPKLLFHRSGGAGTQKELLLTISPEYYLGPRFEKSEASQCVNVFSPKLNIQSNLSFNKGPISNVKFAISENPFHVNGDTRFIVNGWKNYISASLELGFQNRGAKPTLNQYEFGISFGYENGYALPLYNELNAFKVGIYFTSK